MATVDTSAIQAQAVSPATGNTSSQGPPHSVGFVQSSFHGVERSVHRNIAPAPPPSTAGMSQQGPLPPLTVKKVKYTFSVYKKDEKEFEEPTQSLFTNPGQKISSIAVEFAPSPGGAGRFFRLSIEDEFRNFQHRCCPHEATDNTVASTGDGVTAVFRPLGICLPRQGSRQLKTWIVVREDDSVAKTEVWRHEWNPKPRVRAYRGMHDMAKAIHMTPWKQSRSPPETSIPRGGQEADTTLSPQTTHLHPIAPKPSSQTQRDQKVRYNTYTWNHKDGAELKPASHVPVIPYLDRMKLPLPPVTSGTKGGSPLLLSPANFVAKLPLPPHHHAAFSQISFSSCPPSTQQPAATGATFMISSSTATVAGTSTPAASPNRDNKVVKSESPQKNWEFESALPMYTFDSEFHNPHEFQRPRGKKLMRILKPAPTAQTGTTQQGNNKRKFEETVTMTTTPVSVAATKVAPSVTAAFGPIGTKQSTGTNVFRLATSLPHRGAHTPPSHVSGDGYLHIAAKPNPSANIHIKNESAPQVMVPVQLTMQMQISPPPSQVGTAPPSLPSTGEQKLWLDRSLVSTTTGTWPSVPHTPTPPKQNRQKTRAKTPFLEQSYNPNKKKKARTSSRSKTPPAVATELAGTNTVSRPAPAFTVGGPAISQSASTTTKVSDKKGVGVSTKTPKVDVKAKSRKKGRGQQQEDQGSQSKSQPGGESDAAALLLGFSRSSATLAPT